MEFGVCTSAVYLKHLSNVGLFTNVDTIQELTNILILDSGGLSDLSARQRNLGDVNTRDFNLILHISSADV